MSFAAQARERPVEIRADAASLAGTLALPSETRGIVLFAHGSGSGRLSPRNNPVARRLQAAGLGTLLFDLLTDDEARDRRHVFDIDLLATRLGEGTDWLASSPDVPALPLGYFGASTGAAAALQAAARSQESIRAIVSRGGRPDLAGSYLTMVRAPTLLIVGGRDEQVIALNRQAMADLRCETRLEIVPGATHLFEEPGALERVADLARDWFLRYLIRNGDGKEH